MLAKQIAFVALLVLAACVFGGIILLRNELKNVLAFLSASAAVAGGSLIVAGIGVAHLIPLLVPTSALPAPASALVEKIITSVSRSIFNTVLGYVGVCFALAFLALGFWAFLRKLTSINQNQPA